MALQSAFDDYIAILAENKELVGDEKGQLHILRNRTHQMRAIIEKCERTSRFRHLLKETKAAYAKRLDEGDEMWRFSVRNVLRRARIYADAFGADCFIEELFQRFVNAFSKSEDIYVLLAPLEYVELKSNDPLEFDSFRLIKYSMQDLSLVTENETRELFFSGSTLDIGLLAQYWWIEAHYKTESRYPGPSFNIPRPDISVERHFSRFPPTIERILQTLVLYDWDRNGLLNRGDIKHYTVEENTSGWFGFSLPFIIRCGGSLFSPPSQAPDISRLALEPFFDRDGVEIGERPSCSLYFNQAETSSFRSELVEIEKQLGLIRDHGDRWKFIDVGVKHLVKAFFAFELDQLLWHTVAIEALLGERGPSLTKTLARRCGSVLGCTSAERTGIRDSFRKIYDLRSDVVHGNTKLREIHNGHLSVARYIARDVTVWFLKYLCHVAKGIQPNDERLPHRRELLYALDGRRDARKRITHLFDRVPVDFPSSACWDEQ
ncbi:MAG: HEPN domain-containing protein [Gemmatimonadota bacterium]|nr:HEPN domain-containing protein [Gemmatimonadota bacterium]